MKFGKFIQGIASEWASPHYINYKGLKKIIGSVEDERGPVFTQLAASPPRHHPGVTDLHDDHHDDQQHPQLHHHYHEQDSASPTVQAIKTAFFFKLERELEKVNAFYIQKEAEFKVRLRSLQDKKRILSASPNSGARSSRVALRDAFLQFQNDLAKLQKFVQVNATGFRKILKKWDKRAKSATKELYLSRQVEIQPCFNNDVLADLTDIAATNLAELEKQLEDMELDDTEVTSIGGIDRRITKGNSTLDEAEEELAKLLAEKDHALIGQFLQRKRPSALTSEDPQFFSRLFLRYCADTSIECLKDLLGTGQVNINSVDEVNDRSALHEAALAGRLDVVKLALEYGAISDMPDVYGRRPLHYAAMYGRTDCASHFLSIGTSVDTIDHDGYSPLVFAIVGGHTKCVEIFLNYNAVIEPLTATAPIPITLACKYGNTDVVKLLLAKGARLVQDPDGLSPLHMACREGHASVAKLLIEHHADIEAKDPFNGWTPVFFSASEGYYDCIQALIGAGCRINVKDDSGWLPWTYALYRGHINVASLLAVPDTQNVAATPPSVPEPDTTQTLKPMAPSGLFVDETPAPIAMDELDLDEIPSLSLPPPIIPFRIYGHNYLEKKMHLQIHFGSFRVNTQKSPIRLFSSRQLSSLKLIISSRPDEGVPYSVILPLKDELETFSFMVNHEEDYSIQFDIYPTFGTKVIGRAIVLRSQFEQAILKSWNGAGESESMICPLFDTRLHVVGEIAFEFSVIMPFVHAGLRIGGRVETYWKSTKVVANPRASSASAEGVHSLITASSLAEEYVQLAVQLTKDGVPVVFQDWYIPVAGVQFSLAHLTYDQARTLIQATRTSTIPSASDLAASLHPTMLARNGTKLSSADLADAIYDAFLTLDAVLATLPVPVGVHLSLTYPTSHLRATLGLSDLAPINAFVDTVLAAVYNSTAQRSIIFSSFNPSVCTAINWKQPNFGVFFATWAGFGQGPAQSDDDMRCTSIKEAIKFAKASNFLGLICEATPLVQMPVLINTIKESGLILATFGPPNTDPANIKLQESFGVDALIVGRVFKYNT
ncbi:hypothetical protein BC831DRAFT_475818 [Entophlyctis helioformis]|nr:hypothetical protein BC831DRAFT_475818 [Entophlyctis helioformis]